MASIPIEERLVHYFLAMGTQQVQDDSLNFPALTFCVGSEKILVMLLSREVIGERSKIVESLLRLSSLKGTSNQLYLAAPKLLGTLIEVEVFRSHGIGLLLYDDRRIDEAVAAQSVTAPPHESTIPTDPSLLSELANLRSMYAELERSVSKLREDLAHFQETVSSPTRGNEIQPLSGVASPPVLMNPVSELPSFFNNNPWLEVLSKRGRAEEGPLAG